MIPIEPTKHARLRIIVHGGAKEIPAEQHEAHREGCRRAADAGWEVLAHGGCATDAVVAAIRVLENDPTFNAGLGSELNSEGEVQMDAGLMDGESLQTGAVAFIQGVKNPIAVAAEVLTRKEVLLAGSGARRFAEEVGAELCENRALVTPERRRDWEKKAAEKAEIATRRHGTVGAVAMDAGGNVAAGASTGGTGFNRPGRVGDTPQVGCGFFAENRRGGCVMTGEGESISRVVLAKLVVDLVDGCAEPDEAAASAMERLERDAHGDGGCILIDGDGRIGWDHNSGHIAVAYRSPLLREPKAFVSKREEKGHST